jgi:hypothetical protein
MVFCRQAGALGGVAEAALTGVRALSAGGCGGRLHGFDPHARVAAPLKAASS